MKKILLLSLIFVGFLGDSIAATRPTGRNSRGSAGATNSATTAAAPATSARAAVRGAAPAAPAASKGTVGARAAVRRGGTAPVAGGKPAVSARAATTQKVVQSGTKVSTAAKNIVVSEECQAKWEGCMDSFCMMDNANGGRCVCSDKNQELNIILAEIEKLDQQSYQMATFGVERIEMGDAANDAIAQAQAVADSILKSDEPDEKTKKKRTLNLDAWNLDSIGMDDDEFAFESDKTSIENAEGDALYSSAANICSAQIPECANDLNMLRLMYSQKIKSDCSAYENSLKKSKTASQQKLNTAEQALREAALEQYKTANKWDLGQCTVQFKKCMQTTGGCGEDFSKCAVMMAMDSTNSTAKSTSSKSKSHKIKGAVTDIEISASTYDMLMSKKPLCESVTKSCVKVASQVWDTFLKEVAPEVKSAELIAENNARQDCIGNITSCFHKACKDNIDPNDKDGSFDMCLSNPGTMLNVCKIPLNACGIDSSSVATAEQSDIWEYVLARLTAMRVDACTNEVKECLTAEDRCGEDYTQCIGLDTDTIVRMCPFEKLVACADRYKKETQDDDENASKVKDFKEDDVYNYVADIAQGIFLNIDNNFMTECQNALDDAMIKVCGDTENCDNMTVDDGIGTRSLEYKICEFYPTEDGNDLTFTNCRKSADQILDSELGRVEGGSTSTIGSVKPFAGILEGMIFWEEITFDENTGKLLTTEEYESRLNALPDGIKAKINAEIENLLHNIDLTISSIEADPKVQYCMTGRQVQGMVVRDADGKATNKAARGQRDGELEKIGKATGEGAGRFPNLTKQIRMIISNSALRLAKENYNKLYDKFSDQMLRDFASIGQRMAEIEQKNSQDVKREIARQACVEYAKASAIPKGPAPKTGIIGSIFRTLASGGIAALFTGAREGKEQEFVSMADKQMIGSKQILNYDYEATITSTFNWESGNCQRCTRERRCTKYKRIRNFCKKWSDYSETCKDIQF